MKKIIISLVIIGVAAGITLGITGAWWTDKGVSKNQSFVSGSLNLRLSNSPTSGYGDDVSNTWSVDKMVPGGTPYVSTLYMKNTGSVDADYLKFTLKNTPDPAGMDGVMRITELSYAGESLLTGGAGADLDSYVAPTNCDLYVAKDCGAEGHTFGTDCWHEIGTAISNVTTGGTICVAAGTYNEHVINQFSPYDKSFNLIGAGADVVTWTAPSGQYPLQLDQQSDMSYEISGFKFIGDGAHPIKFAGVSFISLDIHDNVFQNVNPGSDTFGLFMCRITGTRTGGVSNIKVHDNVFETEKGICMSNSKSFDIYDNEFDVNTQGIYSAAGCKTSYKVGNHHIYSNIFSSISGDAITLDYWTNGHPAYYQSTIEENSFESIGGYALNVTTDRGTENAENNWWGDFDPSDQVSGDVDYSPYAGGPFIGFINGQDSWANGFADLEDFERSTIVVENPDLLPDSGSYHTLKMGVQLDGPTTGNTFMGGTVGMDMTVTMGQGPAQ